MNGEYSQGWTEAVISQNAGDSAGITGGAVVGRKPRHRSKRLLIVGLVTALAVIAAVTGVIIWQVRSTNLVLADHWAMIDNAQPSEDGYLALYYKMVSFRIDQKHYGVDGTGTATVTVFTPDMKVVFESVYEQMNSSSGLFTSGMAEQMIETAIQDKATPIISTQLSVQLIERDGSWLIEPDEAWNIAITCDAESLLQQYFETIFTEGQ